MDFKNREFVKNRVTISEVEQFLKEQESLEMNNLLLKMQRKLVYKRKLFEEKMRDDIAEEAANEAALYAQEKYKTLLSDTRTDTEESKTTPKTENIEKAEETQTNNEYVKLLISFFIKNLRKFLLLWMLEEDLFPIDFALPFPEGDIVTFRGFRQKAEIMIAVIEGINDKNSSIVVRADDSFKGPETWSSCEIVESMFRSCIQSPQNGEIVDLSRYGIAPYDK